MVVLAPPAFPWRQGNEFSRTSFQDNEAASYRQEQEARSLRDIERIRGKSSLDQIDAAGKNARLNAILAAEIERRQTLGTTQSLLLAGALGSRDAGRGARSEDGAGSMASQVGNSLISNLLKPLSGGSPAQGVRAFNEFGQEVTDARQRATLWSTGDQAPAALAGQALQGMLSNFRWG